MSLIQFFVHFHGRHLRSLLRWIPLRTFLWSSWKGWHTSRREEVVVVAVPFWLLSFKIGLILPSKLEFSLLSLHLGFHLMFSLFLSPLLLFLFPLSILFPLGFLQLVWVSVRALSFHLERQLLKSHIVLSLSLLELLDFLVPLHLVLDRLLLSLPEVFTGLTWIARHLLLKVWLGSWKTSLFVARESGLVVERTARAIESWAWQLRAVWIFVVSLKDFLIDIRVHWSFHGFERAKWSWNIMLGLINHGRLEFV